MAGEAFDRLAALLSQLLTELELKADLTETGLATVTGPAAADAAASGNPVEVGGQMESMADSAPGTRMSTDGDAGRFAMSDGAIYAIPTGPQTWTYHEDSSSALTDTVVHAAPGSGLSLYVTDFLFSNGSAAAAINIFLEEGSSKVLGPWYMEAAVGGIAIRWQTPKKITANTALTITTSAAQAHSLDIQGFIAP